jgi:hypothetical protein
MVILTLKYFIMKFITNFIKKTVPKKIETDSSFFNVPGTGVEPVRFPTGV